MLYLHSWSGSYAGVWSNWNSGSYIDVTLTTDGSVIGNGFQITQIEYVAGTSGTVEAYYLDVLLSQSKILPAGSKLKN